MLQLNGFTRDSLKEMEEKMTNTHKEGEEVIFYRQIRAHAQTRRETDRKRGRGRERERDRQTDRQTEREMF